VKRAAIFLLCSAMVVAATAPALASDAYFAVKAGGFLPNGKGDVNNQGGLKDFDTGFNGELAIGFKPAPYAAIEAGTGFYQAQRSIATAGFSEKSTIYGVPMTVTAKALLAMEKTQFFAGAGAGYYFGLLKRDQTVSATTTSSSTHGNALGYHVVGGFDYFLNDKWGIGAEIKWFACKPKFDDTTKPGTKAEWELGGTTMNLGLKYQFQ